jgi:hypothetical protein
MSNIDINIRGVIGIVIPLAAVYLIKAAKDIACKYIDHMEPRVCKCHVETEKQLEKQPEKPVEEKPVVATIISNYGKN